MVHGSPLEMVHYKDLTTSGGLQATSSGLQYPTASCSALEVLELLQSAGGWYRVVSRIEGGGGLDYV